MFNSKSIYTLNKKDPDAIVYPSMDGGLIRLTRECFASEEEFLYWKRISDKDYHKREKGEHIQANHSISLESLPEKVAATHSSETEIIEHHEQQEREQIRQLLLAGLDNCLTATQRRRLWLHYVRGMTVRQIAQQEKISHPNIVKSILAGRKKLKKFLSE